MTAFQGTSAAVADADWIRGLPEGWSYSRLKWTVASAKNGIWGDNADGGADDIICARVADFDRERLLVDISDPTLRSVATSQRGGRVLQRGDLLLEKSGGGEKQPVGAVVTYAHDEPAVCSNFVARLEVARGNHSRFLTYLHASLYYQRVNTRSIKQTTGIQNLDGGMYLDEVVALPPLATQRAIADFLDRKIAAIDALIKKKERLLELLAEKRAALIHRAVTKGLDPSVPMKDSGVPWIGEIPEHWEVKRLKHVSSFITSGPRGWGQFYSDDGPLFLRITNVARDSVDLLLEQDKRQSVSPPEGAEGVRTLAREGDVLVTITADLGSVGVVPGDLGEAYISQHVAMCRPSGVLRSRLVAYMVGNAWGRTHYDLSMNGGTKVGLTLDDVRNTPLALPPKREQDEIVERLDRDGRAFDAASNALVRQSSTLREHRQALITAAVTGQLDIETAEHEPTPESGEQLSRFGEAR